jgi:haloalkane dehalogenase
MRSRIPGAEGRDHLTITGAGHFVQEDQPLRFAEIIRRFVTEVEEGSPQT